MGFPAIVNEVIPLGFTVVYALVYKFREGIYEHLREYLEGFFGPELTRKLASNFRLELGDWKKTVLLPILLVLLVDTLVISSFKPELLVFEPPRELTLSFIHLSIDSCFFSAVTEELLYRGFFFGVFFVTFIPFMIEKLNPGLDLPYKKLSIALGFFLQLLLFIIHHDIPNLYSLFMRASFGVLSGLIYLGDERNLLPPIVAHISTNFFVLVVVEIF